MKFLLQRPGPLIVAGPCAFESKEQLRGCVAALQQVGVSVVRASLWKPRTLPGWEGAGWVSLPILLEETLPHDLIPATEVITAEHARMVVEALHSWGPNAQMLVWLGARNQNHMEQQRIAKVLAEGPEGIWLMYKNQPWQDERHWIGIHRHLVAAGFPAARLLGCHRGFAPGFQPNPRGYRNLPDHEMAMRVREETGVPMLLDPSHIAGKRELVSGVIDTALRHHYDGWVLEMHVDPDNARTDAKQQLAPHQLRELLGAMQVA